LKLIGEHLLFKYLPREKYFDVYVTIKNITNFLKGSLKISLCTPTIGVQSKYILV